MAYALDRTGADWHSFGVRDFENGARLEEAYPLVDDWKAVREHGWDFARLYCGEGSLQLFLMVSADEYKKYGLGISERLKDR